MTAVEDPPTDRLPKHARRSWRERLYAKWPGAQDFMGIDWLLGVLYVICQAYASVILVALAVWAGLGPLAWVPAAVVDGSQVALAVLAVKKGLPRLVRLCAALLMVVCYVASNLGTYVYGEVTADPLADPNKLQVFHVMSGAPTALVGVLIVLRLVVKAHFAEQRAQAKAAREQAERDAREKAAREAREREERAAAEQREREERAAAVAREREEQERADRLAREQREHEAALARDAADREERRLAEERQAAAEAEERRLRLEAEERERQAEMERARLEHEERMAAAAAKAAKATTPPARKATEKPAPAVRVPGESQAVRGRRETLREILTTGAVPTGSRVEELAGATKGSGIGKDVLRALQRDGAVSPHDPAAGGRTADMVVCREVFTREFPHEDTPPWLQAATPSAAEG